MKTCRIGTWHEKATRDVVQCPSYYAADTETLRTAQGDYPISVGFQTGYSVPIPYWLFVAIDAEHISGRTYSGFGGNNFASRELPLESIPLRLQMYAYGLSDLVDSGKVTIDAEFEWLLSDRPWQHADAPKTFAEIV